MATRTAKTNEAQERRMDRRKSRAIAVSALLIMVMLTVAITFTALSLSQPGREPEEEEVGGGPIVLSLPVSGEFQILKDFDGSRLLWNRTLNQWRSHRAVSIGAAADTSVLATYSGRVTSIDTTSLYGTTVRIDHGNGLESVFRSLGSIIVTEGQNVQRGQKIGTVGNTSRIEFLTDPHVRFELYQNGNRIDPHQFIDFGLDK